MVHDTAKPFKCPTCKCKIFSESCTKNFYCLSQLTKVDILLKEQDFFLEIFWVLQGRLQF